MLVLAVAVVSLGTGSIWARLHAVRLERDTILAGVCSRARGRARSDVDDEYAALGVPSAESCAGCHDRRSYTVLVSPLQSFDCEVELDPTGVVRRSRTFRMTRAEASRFFEVPGWAPAWAEDAAHPVRYALGATLSALTP